jgi:hypothetical protein
MGNAVKLRAVFAHAGPDDIKTFILARALIR